MAETITQQLANNENVSSPDVNQNYMSSNSGGNQKVRILQCSKTQNLDLKDSPMPVAVVEEKILKQPEQATASTSTNILQ